jgi:hypothetical protein
VTDVAESTCRVQRRSRYLFIVVVVVGVAGLVLYRQCHRASEQLQCTTCPPSSLPPEQGCDGPPNATPGTLTNGLTIDAFDVPHNGLAVESIDVPHNGLAPTTLPNRALLRELSLHPLARTMFSLDPGLWRPLLAQPHATDLVEYVVSCALDAGQSVDIPPQWAELDAVRHKLTCGFPGQLGLCGQTYKASPAGQAHPSEPSWGAQPATEPCLERVSACVLARVNAVEARVPISMRGEATELRPRVSVQTQFRENHGTPIQSFQRCDRMCLWGDRLRRNCDWEPRFVGQCVRDPRAGGASEPARKVQLKIASSARVRIRICKGIYGCDDTAPGVGAGAATPPVFANGRLVEFPTYYGGQMVDQAAAEPGGTIAFDCPDDGPLVKDGAGGLLRTGYFSVMLGTPDPRVSLPATADVALVRGGTSGEPFATHDAYPAAELEIFSYREGGFYGSLFSERPPPEPVPNDKFACASAVWSYAAALAANRLCAGPMGAVLPGGCFGHDPPGQCDVPSDAGSCHAAAGSQPEVYDGCRGTPPAWEHPYTTYLNHPCDFFATDEECVAYVNDGKQIPIRKPPRLDHQDQDPGRPKPAYK